MTIRMTHSASSIPSDQPKPLVSHCEQHFFMAALALPAAAGHANSQGFIADCGLRIADCLGEYLSGKESAIRNPKSAMATAISHHDIDPPRRNASLLPENQVAQLPLVIP
jgi:hypothetical protein